MNRKKILIITYYWPPSAGSGVQRWLKFVKYLPQFGWEPFVFTPENPAFAVKDSSLLKDVPDEAEIIRFPIWEPYEAFFKLAGLVGQKKSEKPNEIVNIKTESIFHKVSTWVRGNMLIPDPRRFWIKPSVKFLHTFLKDNKIDCIVTTGPPHSMHLIGYELKKKNPSLQWLADFRDPWSEWGLLDTLRVSGFVRSIHRKLERKVLTTADEVITVTNYYVKRFEALSGRKVQLISNGFDEDDFRHIAYKRTEKFIIRHAGIVNEKSNPVPFMNAVRVLCVENAGLQKDIVIEFVGEIHPDFKKFVEGDKQLSAVTRFVPTIPHKKLVELYGETSALLLIITEYKGAEGYTGGKSFEYIATGLPVIGIGPPEGEAAKLLRETSTGDVYAGRELDKIKQAIVTVYEKWRSGGETRREVNDTYSRRKLTEKLISLLHAN